MKLFDLIKEEKVARTAGGFIWKNPSKEEIEQSAYHYGSVRFVADASTKSFYIAPAKLLHYQIINAIGKWGNYSNDSKALGFLFTGDGSVRDGIIKDINSDTISAYWYRGNELGKKKLLLRHDWSFADKYFGTSTKDIIAKLL